MQIRGKGNLALSGLVLMLAIAIPSSAQPARSTDDETVLHFARDRGISTEEARRRLDLQSLAGDFQADVVRIAPEMFGGLYIENEPGMRVVLLMTDGGRELVAPLLAGRFARLTPIIDIQHADRSMQELEGLVEASASMLAALGQHASFDIDVKANAAIIISDDPEKLIELLTAAGYALPDGVQVRKGKPVENLVRVAGL